MKLLAFSILDVRVGAYSQPFFTATEAAAVRALLCNSSDPTSAISSFPEDYVLYRVGTFDDSTATFETFLPVNLGSAAALRAQLEKEFA